MPDPRMADRVRAIDALLPQTQCRRCGFDGCLPYAAAVADGRADINRCPPGGDEGVAQLAQLLGRDPLPLDPECGPVPAPHVARIDEAHCIGCTLCIQACPVDAIIGGPKHMHVVIAEWCTGCDLCLPPCPVDCIEMIPAASPDWGLREADGARARYLRREARLARSPNGDRDANPRDERAPRAADAGDGAITGITTGIATGATTASATGGGGTQAATDTSAARRAVVDAALARARAKREART